MSSTTTPGATMQKGTCRYTKRYSKKNQYCCNVESAMHMSYMVLFSQVLGGKNIPTDSVHSYEELKKFRVRQYHTAGNFHGVQFSWIID